MNDKPKWAISLSEFLNKKQEESLKNNNQNSKSIDKEKIFYSRIELNDLSAQRDANQKGNIRSYNPNNPSHEDLLAATDYQFDTLFRNPENGETINPSKVFIDEQNKIIGVNFDSSNGNFCCSYVGENFADIKIFNDLDIASMKNINHDPDKNPTPSGAPKEAVKSFIEEKEARKVSAVSSIDQVSNSSNEKKGGIDYE